MFPKLTVRVDAPLGRARPLPPGGSAAGPYEPTTNAGTVEGELMR